MSRLVEEGLRKVVSAAGSRKENVLDVVKTLLKPEKVVETYSEDTLKMTRQGMASDIFPDANIILYISLQRKGFEMAS